MRATAIAVPTKLPEILVVPWHSHAACCHCNPQIQQGGFRTGQHFSVESGNANQQPRPCPIASKVPTKIVSRPLRKEDIVSAEGKSRIGSIKVQ